MAIRVFPIAKEQSIVQLSGGSERGNGKDAHAPVGLSSGDLYRELQQFAHDWDGVAQIEKAELELTRTSGTHVSFGDTPVLVARRVTEAWPSGGGDEGTWSTGASTHWGNQPTVTATGEASKAIGSSADGTTTLDITDIMEAIAPETVLKRDGTACGGAGNKGIRLQSGNEASSTRTTEHYSMRAGAAWRRPRIRLTFNTNHRPEAPTITSPVGTSTAEMVPSYSGTEDVTTFYFVDADAGDSCSLVEVEYYGSGATDGAPGTLLKRVTVPPTVVDGSQRLHSVTVTGLTARTTYRKRVRTRDDSGKNTAWGAWTSLADGFIQTAYRPRKPAIPFMESTPDRPDVFGTIDSADPADFITAWEGEFYRDDPSGAVTLWAPGPREIGGSPTRSQVEYVGATLLAGDRVRWRHRHTNRDAVVGDWSEFYTRTIQAATGPDGMDPADTGTKLLSRTATLTIAHSADFDGYAWRLYRAGVLLYDSGTVTVGTTGTVDVTIPDGLAAWGDELTWDAAIRLDGSGVLGEYSPQLPIYINSLPSTTLTPEDEDGETASVLRTTNVIWSAPYVDQDVARYGETPVAKLLEVRHAATPQGSGALIEQRPGIAALKAIPEDERSGFQILSLTAATGWTTDADVSAGTVASAPTDYTGDSLRLTFAASASDRGAEVELDEPLDLTGFSSHAYMSVWRKLSSEANLTGLYLRLEDVDGYWVEYLVYYPPDHSTGAWGVGYAFLGFPEDSSTEDIDWAAVTTVGFRALVTGSFAATADLRDLVIGLQAFDTSPVDGTYAIVFEESYDVRVRYRDDADALATTTLAAAASASATNVKVASVTGLAVGQDLTIGDDDERNQETRVITVVGTSGSGGTGVTLDSALDYDHADGSTVRALPWGPWTPWRTVATSEPPSVTLVSPTDAATVTTPVPELEFTESSPSGKDIESRTLRIYETVDGSDRLLYEGTGGDTPWQVPYFLLEAAGDYAWEIEITDSDGLVATSERWTFTTDVTVPGELTGLAGTSDADESSVTLAWDESVDEFAFYVVEWLDGAGQWVRVDDGPRATDDGRDPLVTAAFTWQGARLGDNVFRVTAHAGGIGAMQSDPITVAVELAGPSTGGAWIFVRPDDERHTFPLRVLDAPRTHEAAIERYAPPGRGSTVHLVWGSTGRRISVRTQRRPADDGDLVTVLRELQAHHWPGWLKYPSGWVSDPVWCQVVGLTDAPGLGGMQAISIELEETDPDE